MTYLHRRYASEFSLRGFRREFVILPRRYIKFPLNITTMKISCKRPTTLKMSWIEQTISIQKMSYIIQQEKLYQSPKKIHQQPLELRLLKIIQPPENVTLPPQQIN